MSSLLDKLKTLISASARGPRPQEPHDKEETGPPPDVSEATARDAQLPEVTEAPLAQQEAEAPPPSPPSAETSAGRRPEPEEDMEEGRVVDLLNDQADDEQA